MSDPIAPVVQDGVRAAIRRAADATGVNFQLLVETARRESALDPNARARTSSATGLFQFIESTWLDMVRRHGAKHGLGREASALAAGADSQTRNEILALRRDPELAARMAGELTRENADTLRTRLGRDPSAGELYAAHVMGSGGALRLIEAARDGADSAAAIFPREAAANRGLFYVNGEPRSAQALLQRLNLEADTAVSANTPTGAPQKQGDQTPFSPALAHALFTMALLPLLRSGDDAERQNPMAAINAYSRLGR
jgi:hypothetical protein